MPLSLPTPHSLQPVGKETCTDAESGSWICLRGEGTRSKGARSKGARLRRISKEFRRRNSLLSL